MVADSRALFLKHLRFDLYFWFVMDHLMVLLSQVLLSQVCLSRVYLMQLR